MLQTVFSKSRTGAVLLLLAGCNLKKSAEQLPYYNSPDFTPVFVENEAKVNAQITHKIAAFSLENQDGKKISEAAVNGKIHVACFIFTTCGSICPAITNNLLKVGKTFENDTNVVMLSYTVTPWIDNPQKLKAYKENHNIKKPDWYFLTGKKSEIYHLARTSYFAEEDLGFTKDSTEFLHTEHVLLVDQNRRIRGIYNGTLKLEIDQLIKDIGELKNRFKVKETRDKGS